MFNLSSTSGESHEIDFAQQTRLFKAALKAREERIGSLF